MFNKNLKNAFCNLFFVFTFDFILTILIIFFCALLVLLLF